LVILEGWNAILEKNFSNSVGVLDVDITGPSIPRLLGLKGKRAGMNEKMMLSVETSDSIKVISLDLLTEKEDDPEHFYI